jgi:multidrug efflux pump subunit AcrB
MTNSIPLKLALLILALIIASAIVSLYQTPAMSYLLEEFRIC